MYGAKHRDECLRHTSTHGCHFVAVTAGTQESGLRKAESRLVSLNEWRGRARTRDAFYGLCASAFERLTEGIARLLFSRFP